MLIGSIIFQRNGIGLRCETFSHYCGAPPLDRFVRLGHWHLTVRPDPVYAGLTMTIWLMVTGWLEYGTLILLLALSIWSLTIMIDRRRTLQKLSDLATQSRLKELVGSANWLELEKFLQSANSLSAGALKAALQTPQKKQDSVDHAVRSYLTDQRMRLEKGLPILATLGSNAPFIGLFGTVLGIIQAFAVLGNQQGEAASIMTGISRALFATAAGLFVAIPAVVAFNYFTGKIRQALGECDSLKDLYLSRIRQGE
jgi:biopolymer transport protein ExbB/TolQ